MPPLVWVQMIMFVKLMIHPAAGGPQLAHMPPVNADEVDRAILRARRGTVDS
jgi:hypothetical protein